LPELRAFATALLTAAAVGMPWVATVGAEPAAVAAGARVDFRFEDSRIDESSGLAVSVHHPHTLWTVNDSGDSARVFAVDTRTGATVGVHTFDATVRDVEALAITPQGRMLVADIGDNGARRDVVRVFWFAEPALGKTSGPRGASWELAYPDGPHNAEALAVDPRSGRVVVVTKDRVGGIYALPKEPSRTGLNRLTKVASAPATVTDAVFLPDGSALAVRTYTSLHLLDPDTFAPLTSTLLPLQPQGETLAVAPGGTGLLVGSEGKGSRVQQVDLPSLPGADPTTSPPSPTPSHPASSTTVASPASGSGAAQGDTPTPAVNRGELFAGLGAGVGLVLLALLVVRLVGRHRR
jgi:hypothetical protein